MENRTQQKDENQLGTQVVLEMLECVNECLARARVARWPVFHRSSRYFTANLAEARILIISAQSRYFEFAVTLKRTNAQFLKL